MGAQEWQNAASLTMRKQSLNLYGTRTSEFWRLPYWRPTQQVTIDPMHLMFLILQQRFFRDPSALGLEINKNNNLTLERIQQTIQQVIVPAWVDKPPPSIGHAQAGSIKADHWRTMFSLYLPLALISLWSLDSPIKSCDAATMKSALDTAMHLSCASIMMTKSNLTESRRRQFRYSIHQHISGLKENFPAFQLPSHHLSFHLDLFMDLFSNVRNWWCFQGELLILKLRGIPINHRVGKR
ncbi:hypothetical protein EV360DRAFT_51194 [Lentinula raphanica]|nr:hypothetical protein EV360DRAFT_51194 [Lentinula raphanica]